MRVTADAPVVDVQIACDATDIPSAATMASWVRRALAAARSGTAAASEVSVRIVEADEMRALNRKYRQRDAPTNVLSFPSGDIDGLPADATRTLGDIVICADVVNDEAREQGKSRDAHWAHMLVHGSLHLLGYDHQAEAEAAKMEGLEKCLLAQHGLDDPYGESG
ncbi:MAG: rRNA maturation RNase YbeY [Gammaproteobacteria bacterium]|nr:rRNA maturation RNase YbeY [Gammaproteobacteria bacterium]